MKDEEPVDVVDALRHWVKQDQAHAHAAPPSEWRYCITCAYVHDLERAIAEIEEWRMDDSNRRFEENFRDHD